MSEFDISRKIWNTASPEWQSLRTNAAFYQYTNEKYGFVYSRVILDEFQMTRAVKVDIIDDKKFSLFLLRYS